MDVMYAGVDCTSSGFMELAMVYFTCHVAVPSLLVFVLVTTALRLAYQSIFVQPISLTNSPVSGRFGSSDSSPFHPLLPESLKLTL